MLVEHGSPERERLNVLVLFDQGSLHTKTTRDYLESFRLFGRHNFYYVHAVNGAPLGVPLDLFDVILIHYSVRLAYTWHISPHFATALARYHGLKVLFIQDEYDNTWIASDWINKLGIEVVFTNVPDNYLRRIYSRVNHERVEFIQALTGYVPLHFGRCPPPKRAADRPVAIGYRVRKLPFRYGKLGWEKFMIGQRMRAMCEERRIPHDIEWTDDKRIFGEHWLEFLGNCRATLGGESGSNVFDFDGTLATAIDAFLQQNPDTPFEEFFERFLKDRETEEIMNHISPRAFEAIALRTALILFEGRYCNVLKPDVHYIPLKKDFSNIDDVLGKLQDDAYVDTMTERAYTEIIASRQYSYERFVQGVMATVESRVAPRAAIDMVSRISLAQFTSGGAVRLDHAKIFDRPVDASKLFPDPVATLKRMTPKFIRPLAGRIYRRLKATARRGVTTLSSCLQSFN
jgi:hypothetical protein